ncbi:MAG: SGNH/GDSL hydrolase family protein [Armatimonadota bacterium]
MPQDNRWIDAGSLVVEGRAWEDAAPWTRLPDRARGTVRPPVWDLSRNAAGVAVRFTARGKVVRARWTVTENQGEWPHFTATGRSGVDLYVRDPRGRWRYAQVGIPRGVANEMSASFADAGPRECLLYAPLYNGLRSLAVSGETADAIAPPPARPEAKARPVLVYGTSIVQGGCASRPGMAWPSILTRALDRPLLNLGFSGNGWMEPEMAALLAETDPALFVIDCLWNCGHLPAGELERRVEHLARSLRTARPGSPILFVGQSQARTAPGESELTRRQENVVRRLRRAGVPGLHTTPGRPLNGDDDEATVDSVHPSDLGMVRHAQTLLPVVRKLLPAG